MAREIPSVAELLDGWQEFDELISVAVHNAVHQDDHPESWQEAIGALGDIEYEVGVLIKSATLELRRWEDRIDEVDPEGEMDDDEAVELIRAAQRED